MEQILLSLKQLDYLSRSQIQQLHKLGTDRNAQMWLKKMESYLSSFRDSENIYYLNASGRERIGSQKVRKKTIQARHYLMRNELYLALGQPTSWKNEMKLKVGDVAIICDAMYQVGNKYHFVEIDHIQKMNQNRLKIERYRKLIGSGAFKVLPELIWVTTTEHRRHRLKRLCEGINVRVYTIEDLR